MASTPSFAHSLQGEACHEALINLNDGEIKALDQIKTYLVKQISITEQFVHAMNKLNSSNLVPKVPGLNELHSPLLQTWLVYFTENRNVLAILNQFTSMFTSSILPQLDKLLMYFKEVQKQYKSHRFRIDSELKTVCNEETRLKTLYQQHAEDAKAAHVKLEASKSVGKDDKNKEDKFVKESRKVFQNHNDYVLAITAATIQQRHYHDGIIPNLMNSLQSMKQDLVKEWKDIFTDVVDHIKTYGDQNIKLADSMEFSLSSININNPYKEFLTAHGQHPTALKEFTFDESLLDLHETDLVANEIGLNELTYDQLQTKNILLEQAVTDTKAILNQKSSQYQMAKQTLAELKTTSHNFNSMFLKEMAVSELSRELKELGCLHEKDVAQQCAISTTLDKLNGESPSALIIPPLSDSFSPPTSAGVGISGRTAQTLMRIRNFKDQFQRKPPPPLPNKTPNNGVPYEEPSFSRQDGGAGAGSIHRPLPITPGLDEDEYIDDYDKPVETAVEDELWFHGKISRVDSEALLQSDGDYLVRESSRQPGHYVLSTKWSTFRHFIVQQDETCKFKLEGEGFPTVTHLIDYHRNHQCPVTKKSNALLRNAIPRARIQNKNLSHDNIEVTAKLGRGHFGDVMKGRLQLKDMSIEVAIKSCRDNVSPMMKEKFLQEADILAQYDHPNIVKLIGVAIDKEPVYIVMELMAGGDYLNYLRKYGDQTNVDELLQFAIDAASGLTYLESKSCIHRDLAARNCLLDKVKILKISDFGMSRETDLYECSNMREIPVKWTAPEALNYSQYTSQSDVWSFGVLLYETYSLGNVPYPGMSNKETREQVDRGYRMSPPTGTPGIVYELMKNCWEYEPSNRPTFRDILQRLKQLQHR